jgi:hypothetical protein
MSKLSLKFLKDNGVCDDAYAWTAETFQENFAIDELLDWDLGRSKLIVYCDENPNITIGWVKWFDELKISEAFVRFNGKEITMGSYQVFNPITGVHTEYQTEDEAKIAMVDIAKQVLQNNIISVCRAINNENGDSSWIPIDLGTPYDVVLKT